MASWFTRRKSDDKTDFRAFNFLASRPKSKSTTGVPTVQEHVEGEQPETIPEDDELPPLDDSKNPLGLTLVHKPKGTPSCDIIFVHGLGGTSRGTWSWERDTAFFWPGKWLPHEAEVSTARIFTFGYDADFHARSGVVSGITDFAKDLLFALKFPEVDEATNIQFGKYPIIFVCHSMGGLVVKKACMIGENNNQYEDIVACIKAILFLATPHRGSEFADTLNNVLAATLRSSKRYVKEIAQNSFALEELNETFRNRASKTQIFSFYETLKTAALSGTVKLLVVEKESAMLGYPDEISSPLRADHHTVTKFENQSDENYASVRNTLQNLVRGYRRAENELSKKTVEEIMDSLASLLSISDIYLPDEDHSFFSKRRAAGTGSWILSDPTFVDWTQQVSKSGILWLSLPPGAGKSTLMSAVIDHLHEQNQPCQYFYFRFADQVKRKNASLLKVIAFQLAQRDPNFRDAIHGFLRHQHNISSIEASSLWQKLFVSNLFKLEHGKPLFIVIDGLDESESPLALLEQLAQISFSKTPIKVFVSGRPTNQLTQGFAKVSKTHMVQKITSTKSSEDMETFARNTLEDYEWPDSIKDNVVSSILQKSQHNFLWVRLALDEVTKCHTPEAILEALEEIPPEMQSFYARMEMNLLNSIRQGDKKLAKMLLSWVACSKHPLHVTQLVEAMHPDMTSLLAPRNGIAQLCGQFAIIDRKDRVTMLHQTARDYLMRTPRSELFLNASDAHSQHTIKCMTTLLTPFGFGSMDKIEEGSFLEYAVVAWPFHLRQVQVPEDDVFDVIVQFLRNRSVLDWIYSLAQARDLKNLVDASQALTHFVRRRKRLDADRSPLLHRLDDEDLLNDWATDFVRLVGKFGVNLLQDPHAIYKVIPPFCPRTSAIFRQFAGDGAGKQKLKVSGIWMEEWDDNVARLSLGHDVQAKHILCSPDYFVIATSAREVIVWDAVSFERIQTFKHNNHIMAMDFNWAEDKIVTVGYRTTSVWDIATGEEEFSIPSIEGARAMTMTMSSDDTRLLVGCDDSNVRMVDIRGLEEKEWHLITDIEIEEQYYTNARYPPAPCWMDFNGDASQIAMAYRSAPLSVYSVATSQLIGKCTVRRGEGRRGSTQTWMAVDRVTWHPSSGDVLGLYVDRSIFKWHPLHDEYQEIKTNAVEIICSPEGSIFITSDNDGCIKIYSFHHFSLMYQLSGEDLINGFCISPDCRRFYDIRGSMCNVWEPNVLTRLSGGEERDDDAKSITSSTSGTMVFSEAEVDEIETITATAPMNHHTRIVVGNEEGVVNLYDFVAEATIELWRSPNYMVVDCLAWSDDDKYLLAGDLFGKISMNEILEAPAKDKIEVRTVVSRTVGEHTSGIVQLLLSPANDHLLIVGRGSSMLWSVQDGGEMTLICEKEARSKVRRFANNPHNQDQLLGVYGPEVLVCLWRDLSKVISLSLDYGVPKGLDSPFTSASSGGRKQSHAITEQTIRGLRATFSEDRSYMVLHTAYYKEGRLRKLTRILKTNSLGTEKDSLLVTETEVPGVEIPRDIFESIEVPIGIVGKRRFVYVDKSFWVCSWDIPVMRGGSPAARPNRHFFLPKDWLGSEELRLSCFGKGGAFLYPRNGVIATIWSEISDGI